MKCKSSISGESYIFVANKFADEVTAEPLSGLSCAVFHLKEKGTANVLGTFEVLISKSISVSL